MKLSKYLGIIAIIFSCCLPLQAAEYKVDLSHTSVYFGVAHFERSQMRGRFNKIEVNQLQFDGENSQIDLQIDVDSVDSGSRLLDGIIRSEQFLDSKEYPFMRFQSKQFVFAGKQLQTVHGQLSLRGQTRPVSLHAQRFQCGEVKILIFKRYVCGGDFSASILRSAFGIKHLLPDVGDEVQLQISIEALPVAP